MGERLVDVSLVTLAFSAVCVSQGSTESGSIGSTTVIDRSDGAGERGSHTRLRT